jgi:hypothetical protein
MGIGNLLHTFIVETFWSTLIQKITGANPTTGLPSGRLVNRPMELSITVKPQFTQGMVLSKPHRQISDFPYSIMRT